MGIMSNTTSISRFKTGPPPGSLHMPSIHDRLIANRFRSIADTPEEMSVGWVELRDHKSTDFPAEDILVGDYISLSIRIDQRKIPPAVLKERTDPVLADYLAKNPALTWVPKQVKLEIKEAVYQQLLPQTLPVPTTYDLIWNIETGELWYANTSTRGLELLDKMWRKTFPEISMRMLAPFDIAGQSAPNLLPALTQANQASSESLLDMMVSNKWLGQDFLLWFLYTAVTTPTEGENTTWTDDKVVLEGNTEGGRTVITINGPQARLPELKAALKEGKQITEATLYFLRHADESEWKVTLKGETFYMNGFKCPSVHLENDGSDPDDERKAVFLERIALVQAGINMLQQELARFLAVRLTSAWETTREEMRGWLEE